MDQQPQPLTLPPLYPFWPIWASIGLVRGSVWQYLAMATDDGCISDIHRRISLRSWATRYGADRRLDRKRIFLAA